MHSEVGNPFDFREDLKLKKANDIDWVRNWQKPRIYAIRIYGG